MCWSPRCRGGGPRSATVQSINNGGALQIAVPEDAPGAPRSSTGRRRPRRQGHRERARSRCTTGDVNAAPKQKRMTTLTIETGGMVTYNVLPDWIDPDGDDVFLKAVVAAQGDEADFTLGRRITYRATRRPRAARTCRSSSRTATRTPRAIVRFDVRPPGSTDPSPTPTTWSPVSAGRSPSRRSRTTPAAAASRCASRRVDEVDGATVVPDFANKTFTFTAPSRRRLLRAVPGGRGIRRMAPGWCASTSSRRPTAICRPSPCATSRCCRAAARCSSTCSSTTPTRPAASSSSSP